MVQKKSYKKAQEIYHNVCGATWTIGSDEVNLLLYASMKQFLSSSGIKSLNGSHAADLKLKLLK
jgi:hypothetical protein